ncbi:MAG: DUF167 domain-containing protein [Candidatus Tectimicrobiota bacterium]
MEALRATATGTLLRLRVQPRSSVARLEGVQDGYLRLRLTARPVDGAANAACVAFLAQALGVKRSQVCLQAGEKSRQKLIHVTGLTPAQVAAALGLMPT